MAITQVQQDQIRQAHAQGALDRELASVAGVSLSTVKRVRKALGLITNCPVNRRGRRGERLLADAAAKRGLKVEWRTVDAEKYDLIIQGLRVDAKSAAPSRDGRWRFRLPDARPSFFGQYVYAKNYATDADVVVLVALNTDETAGDLYILPSHNLPSHIQLRPGSNWDVHLDAWHLFAASSDALKA